MPRGRPPREDGRRYVRVGVELTPAEQEYINDTMSTDMRREAMLVRWPEIEALVKAARRWQKLNGLLTVAFAQIEHTHPDWVRERWISVSNAITETQKVLAPFEDTIPLHDPV